VNWRGLDATSNHFSHGSPLGLEPHPRLSRSITSRSLAARVLAPSPLDKSQPEPFLAPARARYRLRGATTTRPSTWLKQQIPIRTFTEWNDGRPGFLEVDLVAHCGGTTRGFFLFTLCAVDVATSWIELQALWGKGQARVRGGIHEIRKRLPVPSGRPRQRQRFRVHQPPAVLLLSARGPHGPSGQLHAVTHS